MVQIKGSGLVFKKETKVGEKFTNYYYDITISASKANKQNIIPTTNIKLLANKDMGGEVGSNVEFTAEVVPFTKKDGSGTSYFFKALSMNFKDNTNGVDMSDIDDEIPF